MVPSPQCPGQEEDFDAVAPQVGIMVPLLKCSLRAQGGLVPGSWPVDGSFATSRTHGPSLQRPCCPPALLASVPVARSDGLPGGQQMEPRPMDQVSAAQVVPEHDAQRPNLVPGDTAPCHTAGLWHPAQHTAGTRTQGSGATFIPTVPRRPAKGRGCAHSLWFCTFSLVFPILLFSSISLH